MSDKKDKKRKVTPVPKKQTISVRLGKVKEETSILLILKKLARETWDSWIIDLEEQDQPACDIENQEDCENCGS